MPEQNSIARASNFEEVNLGFPEQFALLEADRCLQFCEALAKLGRPNPITQALEEEKRNEAEG